MLLGGLCVLELELKEAVPPDPYWQVSSAFSHLPGLQTNLVLLTGMVSEDHSKKTLCRFLFPDVGTGVNDGPR